MPKQEKAQFVDELQERIKQASAIYFVDFTKVQANDFNELRRRARQERMTVKVVKNRLALLALKECGVPETIGEFLRGPSSIIFAGEDPIAPARLLKEMGERLPGLKFKGAYFDGALYGAGQFDFLSSLPTKGELRGQLVGVLASPLGGLVGVLEGLLGELVWVLEGVAGKKTADEGLAGE